MKTKQDKTTQNCEKCTCQTCWISYFIFQTHDSTCTSWSSWCHWNGASSLGSWVGNLDCNLISKKPTKTQIFEDKCDLLKLIYPYVSFIWCFTAYGEYQSYDDLNYCVF